MKLDIEGAEYEVLPVLLSRAPLPRWISMEVHDWSKRGGELLSRLKALGYDCEVMTDNSPAPLCAALHATLNPGHHGV